MEESITAQAGGQAGEFVAVDLIEEKAREMGRVAVERTTTLQETLRKKGSQWRAADQPLRRPITTLAGGVGAAKFIRGLVRRVDPRRLTVIVNTGDDEHFYGLHVSPDVDTVIYTLAGVVNRAPGLGPRGRELQRARGARALLRQGAGSRSAIATWRPICIAPSVCARARR